MTQKLRWATLAEDPTWVESTHGNSLRTAWNSTFRRSDTSGLCGHLHTYVHPPHTHTYTCTYTIIKLYMMVHTFNSRTQVVKQADLYDLRPS